MKNFYNILIVVALIFGMLPIGSAFGQGTYDKHKEEVEEALSIINSERKKIIIHNISLSNDEDHKFWSLYDEYRLTRNEVGKRRFKMVADYADSLENKNLSDAKILGILKEYISIEHAKLTHIEEYISKFQKILPPKKVFLFFQIENKFDANVNFAIARKIPLIK